MEDNYYLQYKNKENVAADGNFGCPLCAATGLMNIPLHSNNKATCVGCKGSGYLVDYLITQLGHLNYTITNQGKEINKLRLWISSNSKCTLCKGDSYKTLCGFPCPECKLEGNQPMGG